MCQYLPLHHMFFRVKVVINVFLLLIISWHSEPIKTGISIRGEHLGWVNLPVLFPSIFVKTVQEDTLHNDGHHSSVGYIDA